MLASLGNGCYVGTEKRTASRVLSVERSPLVVGPAGGLALHGEVIGNRLEIRATRHRDCHHRIVRVIEQRTNRVSKLKTTTADLGNGNPGGGAAEAVFILALFPVVFALSGVVSTVRVVGSGTKVERVPEPGEIERFACPAHAPGTHLELTLPSGAIVDGSTDALGRYAFTIPDHEPRAGSITVRALEPPATSPPENERADDPRLEPTTVVSYAR